MTESQSWRNRLNNRLYAIPAVTQLWARRLAARSQTSEESDSGIPFARLTKALAQSTAALITTGGIHLPEQTPFDMVDPDGDASYREIPGDVDLAHLQITHNYYDHRDADADVNVIFPLNHLRDLVQRGVLGRAAPRHYGLMGHIEGGHVQTLMRRTGPEIAAQLRADGVDFAFLTPA